MQVFRSSAYHGRKASEMPQIEHVCGIGFSTKRALYIPLMHSIEPLDMDWYWFELLCVETKSNVFETLRNSLTLVEL